MTGGILPAGVLVRFGDGTPERVVHLQPARPVDSASLAEVWAWGALRIPCRAPDEFGRCGVCAPCEARADALAVWFL